MQLVQLFSSLFSNEAENCGVSLLSTVLHEYVLFHTSR